MKYLYACLLSLVGLKVTCGEQGIDKFICGGHVVMLFDMMEAEHSFPTFYMDYFALKDGI